MLTGKKQQKKTYGNLGDFLLHMHPPMINKSALKYSRTFGLGGINALLFLVLVITGLLLKFSYFPTPELAYDSILNLQKHTLLGSLLRNCHHWAANFMVITSFLHLLRVFYTQSIYNNRKKNWYYGLCLFALVLAFNFTGYLLPWDQLSFWAVTIVSNMPNYIPVIGEPLGNFIRGGNQVDGQTLLNFYNLHTAILPLFFVILMSIHFYLVRKAKGVTIQNHEDKIMVKTIPHLVIREAVVALIVLTVLLLFSMMYSAPLLDYANPQLSPNPIKAPWYFAGMQELLIHIHPVLAVLIVPCFFVAFLIWMPNQKIEDQNIGKWHYNNRGKTLLVYSISLSVLCTSALLLLNEYVISNIVALSTFQITSWLSFFLYIVITVSILSVLNKKFDLDKIEYSNVIFNIIFSSYIIMSIISIYFRGHNMELIL